MSKLNSNKMVEEWEKLRKGYEEVQMVESPIENAYPEAYRLARKFHELYEEQAPFFGYITNPNTREFYPNSNNARLMAYVCYHIIKEEISLQKIRTLEEVEGWAKDNSIQGVEIMKEKGSEFTTPRMSRAIGYSDALSDLLAKLTSLKQDSGEIKK